MTYKQLDERKKKYPKGTRIELIGMDGDDDFPTLPKGTKGTVKGVNDKGIIIVDWDNGCQLSLLPEIDECRIID